MTLKGPPNFSLITTDCRNSSLLAYISLIAIFIFIAILQLHGSIWCISCSSVARIQSLGYRRPEAQRGPGVDVEVQKAKPRKLWAVPSYLTEILRTILRIKTNMNSHRNLNLVLQSSFFIQEHPHHFCVKSKYRVYMHWANWDNIYWI